MSDARNVVCLPGIWMPGAGMLLVKYRLESNYDFAADMFDYSAVTETLDEVANNLADFIAAGVTGFGLQAIPNKPDVYQELDTEVLSAFD